MALPFWDRHRGPYRLVVCRPAKRTGYAKSEALSGEIAHGAEAQEEAQALLADSRDTIEQIAMWSVSEECFVGTYRKENH